MDEETLQAIRKAMWEHYSHAEVLRAAKALTPEAWEQIMASLDDELDDILEAEQR